MHEVKMTETNTRGWVALCSCGWQSIVYPTPRVEVKHKTPGAVQQYRFEPEHAIEAARIEWYEHCRIEAQKGPLKATQIIDPAELAHIVIPKR